MTREHGAGWHAPAALAVLVSALGALVGSMVAAVLEAGGVGWDRMVLPPLMALIAATSVYSQYRHLPLDWLQARTARAMVSTASAMLLAGVALGRPGLAVISLWSMTAVTITVTALAAGAGASEPADETSPSAWTPSR